MATFMHFEVFDNLLPTLLRGLQVQGKQPCAVPAFVQTHPPATRALVCHRVVQMQLLLPDDNSLILDMKLVCHP